MYDNDQILKLFSDAIKQANKEAGHQYPSDACKLHLNLIIRPIEDKFIKVDAEIADIKNKFTNIFEKINHSENEINDFNGAINALAENIVDLETSLNNLPNKNTLELALKKLNSYPEYNEIEPLLNNASLIYKKLKNLIRIIYLGFGIIGIRIVHLVFDFIINNISFHRAIGNGP